MTVEMPYREATRSYAIGFAGGLFGASVVFAYPILLKQYIPETVYQGSVIMFVMFSVVGFLAVALAYTAPEWFYEVLENDG